MTKDKFKKINYKEVKKINYWNGSLLEDYEEESEESEELDE